MRRTTPAGLLLVVGLAGGACSSPSQKADGSRNNGSAGNASLTVTLDPAATGPAPAVPGARAGGTVTVLTAAPRNQFEPASAYTSLNEVLKLTNRALTVFTERNGRSVLVPDLATDLGQVSADGLTWTFRLKDGLRHEDGSPVVAADVGYAVQRSFAHDLYQGGPTYQDEHFVGGDTYKGPYRSGAAFPGVSTPDDRTVVFHLRTPFPDLPYFASFPVFSPVPKAKDTRSDYGLHPLATGPYKFESFRPSTELVLVRNPQWDPNSDPGRHQYPDRYVMRFNQDTVKAQTQIIASNGPDATTLNFDGPDASLVPKLQTPAGQQHLVTGAAPCIIWTTLNTQKLPLAVRRAVLAAWPYDSYRKATGTTPLTSVPATTLLPPGTPGYQKADVLGNGGAGDGDPAKAKQLLAQAGKTGFTLVWYYGTDNAMLQKSTEVMRDKLSAAGFTTKPIGVPTADVGPKSFDVSGPANIAQAPGGWCLDWPSAATMFQLFHGRSVGRGYSAGFLDDKSVNAEIDRLSALDPLKAASGWATLDQRILRDHLPVIPLGYNRAAFVVGSKLGNVVNDPVVAMPDFTLMYVKQ
jgi:peptide/nickel transport system substrate-binding protein